MRVSASLSLDSMVARAFRMKIMVYGDLVQPFQKQVPLLGDLVVPFKKEIQITGKKDISALVKLLEFLMAEEDEEED